MAKVTPVQETQEAPATIGPIKATGMILASVVELALISINALLPAARAVENVAITAELHTEVFKTQAQSDLNKELAALQATIK